MIRFNNDYNKIAHENVLKALSESVNESYAGYGDDEMCETATSRIRNIVGCSKAAVYFIPGATQVNYIVASASLSPIQSIICADTGHINCHEAASIENTGHKIVALPNTDGKISAEQIEREASEYFNNGEAEYSTEPHLVYISFATELGTIYSRAELDAISAVCKKYNMILFVDGARLGYGLGASDNDVSIGDFAALCDVFYIGGTKCGAMFGEALVIVNPLLARKFKTYMKQNGAVLAKGWLMGIQFAALMENRLYFQITKRADELAMRIRDAFAAKGVPEYVKSTTNQQFVILRDEQKRKLSSKFVFEEMGNCVRFCTSWATTEEEVNELIEAINAL